MTHKSTGIHRACDKRQIPIVQTSLIVMLVRVNPLLRGQPYGFLGGTFSFGCLERFGCFFTFFLFFCLGIGFPSTFRFNFKYILSNG